MAAGASVTWTYCSVRCEVTWGKTLPSARTPTCVRTDASASTRMGSVHAMDAKGLHKGSSNIPFSLPSSPWPREAMICLVYFVVWAAIGGSFLVIFVFDLQIKFFSTQPFEDYFKVVAA
jgi:hypothetical protein